MFIFKVCLILILVAQITFIILLSIFKARKKLKGRKPFEENQRVSEFKKKQKESRTNVLEALKFEINHELLEKESILSTEESVESIQPVRV